jgi:hypothetical protein
VRQHTPGPLILSHKTRVSAVAVTTVLATSRNRENQLQAPAKPSWRAKGTPQSRLPGVAIAPKSQPRKRSLNHTGTTSLLASQHQRATAVYNLATAAAAAGINKSTVLRHIKAGKVSATRDQNGGWQIDPAEFHRTFPPLLTASAEQPPRQQDATADAMVALLREQLADMRQQRDHWQIEAADWKRQAQNLLPPPQPAPQQAATSETASATEPATTGNRLVRTWRWLRSTG